MNTLKQVTNKLDIWGDWRNSYNEFVPQFIEEASTKVNWDDWDKNVFYEFFERAPDQCVSSLQQGYFKHIEKDAIKNNWHEIGPLLKQIAQVQDNLQIDVYKQLAKELLKYTSQNRVASTNRLIASLQPKLLCTVVNDKKLKELIKFLHLNIDPCPIEKKGTWYERSKTVLDLFVSELNRPATEIMTLPWQVYEHYKSGNNIISNDMSEANQSNEEILELIKYKKQIILQGPPGTGKTRLAKELANSLTTFSKAYIQSNLRVGQTIDNVSGSKDYYTVKALGENNVSLFSKNTSQDWKPSYGEIINKYNSYLAGEKVEITNGLNPYESAVAKHFFELSETDNETEQVKIIQFHPSYSYEDFVRGISVKSLPDGKGVVYETENRTFGKIIEEANRNLIDSQKDTETLSYENWVAINFEAFIEFLSNQMEEASSTIKLTDKVNIVSIEDDALRYKGRKGWSKLGNRMLFDDLIQAIVDENLTRQDIKKNANLSGLAKWHASYYIRVADLFRSFIEDKELKYESTATSLVPRKEFVLIIDEINRANLSAVLGELIYALEYRNEGVGSIYSLSDTDDLLIPDNLHIIGTMNTADRSVTQIDYAIRRRFAFVDVLPKNLEAELGEDFKKDLFNEVAEIFIKDYDSKTDYANESGIINSEYLSEEFSPKDVWLGHSYFIQQYETDENGIDVKEKPHDFDLRLKFEIKPILREYVKDGILKAKTSKRIEGLTCSE